MEYNKNKRERMYTDDSIIRRFPSGKSSREFPNAIKIERLMDS
jgi:hypothetical protein